MEKVSKSEKQYETIKNETLKLAEEKYKSQLQKLQGDLDQMKHHYFTT